MTGNRYVIIAQRIATLENEVAARRAAAGAAETTLAEAEAIHSRAAEELSLAENALDEAMSEMREAVGGGELRFDLTAIIPPRPAAKPAAPAPKKAPKKVAWK